jgi:hypothetical protein
MSLLLSAAAIRAYDTLKRRPGARVRHSDARDAAQLAAVTRRIHELIEAYRITGNAGTGGGTYVFWTEILREIEAGAFDDLLDRF